MNKKKYVNRNYLTTTRIIALGFLITVIVGTILLSLPIASANGTWTDLLTAAFTSTTSVCVTGLVVVDTFSYWSLFGKGVILILIQIGGLGFITVGVGFSTVYVVIKNEDNLEKYNAVAGCI